MKNTWKDDFKYWDFYKDRYKKMMSFFNLNKVNSVVDLGSGPEYLREFIPDDIHYYPVDYLKKTENTIIRDFNNGEFLKQLADIYVAGGLLEYIYDLPKFISKVSKFTNCIVATYRFPDSYPDLNRDILVNHYSQKELFKIFKKAGFKILLKPVYNKDYTIFIAIKNKPKFLNYKMIKKYNSNNQIKILEQIFSVKNEYSENIKHKVINILGIKIKLKLRSL